MNKDKFVKDWIKKANNETDVFNEFFSYYVALNYLYNNMFEDINSEKERLVLFICSAKERINILIDMSNYLELTKQQLYDMRKNRVSKLYKLDEVKNNNIIHIFLMIYQVRCNLFHGGKELLNERNENIVKESNVILSLFLNKYLEVLNNE